MRQNLVFLQSYPVIVTEQEAESEIWKPVVEFPNYYEVSNLGRVRSKDRIINNPGSLRASCVHRKGKMLRPHVEFNSHSEVTLTIETKTYSRQVHRLVLEAFNPITNSKKYQVKHIDFNWQNCRLNNLEWVDHIDSKTYILQENSHAEDEVIIDLSDNSAFTVAEWGSRLHADSHSIMEAIARRQTFIGKPFAYADSLPDNIDVDEYVRQLRGNSHNSNYSNKRKVTDLTTGVEYDSVVAAFKSVNGTWGITRFLSAGQPYKGHVFIYSDEIPDDFDSTAYVEAAMKGYTNQYKQIPVEDLTTGKKYVSINAAAASLGIDSENMRKSISKQAQCKGHIFVLSDSLSEEEKLSYVNRIKRKTGAGIPVKIKDETTGAIFCSYSKAGKSLGGTDSGVRYSIQNGSLYKGHKFVIYEDQF